MNNPKEHLTSNSTMTDNKIFDLYNLSGLAMGLYIYMDSRPIDYHFSQERLAKKLKCTEDKIKRALKELFTAGILTREFTSDIHGKKKSHYYYAKAGVRTDITDINALEVTPDKDEV